jgi:hypothetical protein
MAKGHSVAFFFYALIAFAAGFSERFVYASRRAPAPGVESLQTT